jgi:virulence-associated protein VapD
MKAEQELVSAKKSIVTFLNQHYKNNKQLSVFINEINYCSSTALIKSKIKSVAIVNRCDEIQNLMIETEKQKSKNVQIDAALFELNHLKGV